jgi:methyltransferase (TIGR00027 family)
MGRSGRQLRRSLWACVDYRDACRAIASLSVSSMQQDRSSRTAAGAALMRAAHQVLDDNPHILDDSVSIGLVEGSGREELLAHADGLRSAELKVARSWSVMRSRFAQDCLREACANCVGQFVILGAGFDTFAYRQPEWAKGLRIFEVDQPATQAVKRERLDVRAIPRPANLAFVPCDFEREALPEVLAAASFDAHARAFFSWLGVTPYLSVEAIEVTLRFVAGLPRGSSIVFTFNLPEALLGGSAREHRKMSVNWAGSLGEPHLTMLPPQEWMELLKRVGFSSVFHLTPAIAQARYFVGRRDGLAAVEHSRMMLATV